MPRLRSSGVSGNARRLTVETSPEGLQPRTDGSVRQSLFASIKQSLEEKGGSPTATSLVHARYPRLIFVLNQLRLQTGVGSLRCNV